MASDHRLRELEEKYEGYQVYDNAGERIGKVDDLFVDEVDREEYIGVKMGFFGLSSTLIPMELVRIDERERIMEVADSKEHVKDAPTFDDDDDITPEFEDLIRRHFGLGSASPSTERGSYGRYTGATAGGAMATEGEMRSEDRVGRESYRDREDLTASERVTGTGEATPSGGLRDLETGERDRTRDEGFREGRGRREFGDRGDVEPSGTATGAGPVEEGMTGRSVDEQSGGPAGMEDERYREGFREGFREGLRAASSRGGSGDRGDLGASGSLTGAGASDEGITRRGTDELGDRGRVGDEGFREGGPRERATGAARIGDESQETPRRSDEGERQESGLTRVWRRIREM